MVKTKNDVDLLSLGFNTRAAKTYLDGEKTVRPLSLPIQQSTTFQAGSSEDHGRLFKNDADTVYQRFGHPNTTALANKIAALESSEAAVVFSSGMSAISTSLLAVLRPGDHVVAQREIFAQTYTFLDETARGFGIATDFIKNIGAGSITQQCNSDTKLIYIETPSNPLLQLSDIKRIAEFATSRGIELFVDSTFASPYLQNPLELGATLVLHSGTKFISGHSDVMCGVAAGRKSLVERIRKLQILLGGVLDPNAAWLALRGLKTLGLRMQKQSENALQIARFLASFAVIKNVRYPWLQNSPQYELAKRQMRAGGGVVSFEVDGGLKAARAFVDSLDLIVIATSLGGVETVVEIPAELDFSEDELGTAATETGISPGLIRLSVGIEDIDDLIADLRKGIGALQA